MFCNYLNVGVVLGLLAAKRRWVTPSIAYALIAAAVVCAVFTISIGLGIVFMSLCLSPLVIDRNSFVASKVLGAVGIAVAMAFLVLSCISLGPRSASDSSSFIQPSSRILVWQDAFRTFTSHPITGNGLGVPIASTIVVNTDGSKSLLTDGHNSFLNVAAQSGTIGLAAFIALTIYLLWIWSDSFRSPERIVTRSLGLAFTASFVLQGLTGSFEEARHLWVLIGFLIAADRLERATTD
jgi:O-antigen ligase